MLQMSIEPVYNIDISIIIQVDSQLDRGNSFMLGLIKRPRASFAVHKIIWLP